MGQTTILLALDGAQNIEDVRLDGQEFVFTTLSDASDIPELEGGEFAFLDWVLPTMSGLELCRLLRATDRGTDLHVTMMLDASDPEDRRRAIRAGADDYMVGDIRIEDIIARVQALSSSRQSTNGADTREFGDFVVDMRARLARFRGQPIKVHPNQFRLLVHFLENANMVQSRDDLIGALRKGQPPISVRTVDKWVARLRWSLDVVGAGHLLRTVHFEGYVLDIG